MATNTRTATFIRHYVEMVVVMFAGMIVVGAHGNAGDTRLHIGSVASKLSHHAPTSLLIVRDR